MAAVTGDIQLQVIAVYKAAKCLKALRVTLQTSTSRQASNCSLRKSEQ